MTAAEGKRSRDTVGSEEGSAKGIACRRMVLECSGRWEATCLSFLPSEQLGPQRWESTCHQASVTLRLYRLGVIVSILTSSCFTQHPGYERVLC